MYKYTLINLARSKNYLSHIDIENTIKSMTNDKKITVGTISILFSYKSYNILQELRALPDLDSSKCIETVCSQK